MSLLIRLAKCTPILYCLAFYISWGFMPPCCRPMTLGLNIGGWDANAARRPPPPPPAAKLREKGKAINEPSVNSNKNNTPLLFFSDHLPTFLWVERKMCALINIWAFMEEFSMFQLAGHDKLLYIMSYSFIRNLKTRTGKQMHEWEHNKGHSFCYCIITKTDDEREKGKK